jgi:hypothetical protein
MNFAVALLGAGLGVGQPAAPDYYPMTDRNLKLMIAYTPEERKNIRQVQLFASRDLGQTWELTAAATPDKDFFAYIAPNDGMYWFNMVVVFTDGTKDPPDVTKAPHPQKILVDATPPAVRIDGATRSGDEVTVEWAVDEKYPNPAKTRLAFRPAAGTDADWKDVPLSGGDARSARFNPNTTAAVLVRVTAEDLAGNARSASKEVGGVTTSAFLSPAEAPQPVAAAGGPVAPPNLELDAPPPASLPAPTMQPVIPTGPPAPVVDLPRTNPPQAPVVQPTPTPEPVPQVQPAAAAAPPAPIAVGSGTHAQPTAAQPAAGASVAATPQELPPSQVINFTRFELPYQIEAGPSGVRQIDLYVTRDDGRTWAKWSQHDGKESPLKVNLQTRFDQRAYGRYGFKLVPVSGAGLSDEPPRPGTPPDFRVQVDTVPPLIKIYRPEADPNNRHVLSLVWSISEENLGKDPVSLEWSDTPAGPWRSVVSGDAVVAAAGGQNVQTATRIANTGRYAWSIPPNLPSHMVYLKVTAYDAAGNKSELVTPEPILVDLTKPRARIQGVQPAQTRP